MSEGNGKNSQSGQDSDAKKGRDVKWILDRNKFVIGQSIQRDRYNKTVLVIADYVGETYSMDMRFLVKEGKEQKFELPNEPRKDASRAELELYKIRVSQIMNQE